MSAENEHRFSLNFKLLCSSLTHEKIAECRLWKRTRHIKKNRASMWRQRIATVDILDVISIDESMHFEAKQLQMENIGFVRKKTNLCLCFSEADWFFCFCCSDLIAPILFFRTFLEGGGSCNSVSREQACLANQIEPYWPWAAECPCGSAAETPVRMGPN